MTVEPGDGTETPSFCCDPLVKRRTPRQNAMPLIGYDKHDKTPYLLVRALDKIDILAQYQIWVLTHKVYGLVVIQTGTLGCLINSSWFVRTGLPRMSLNRCSGQ